MADETQEEEQFEVSERVKARLRGAQWVIEDLRASERTFRDGEDEETGKPKEQIRKRVTLIRKCEWPEKMDAEEAVKYLASPACKEVLRLCGEELEGKDWEPRFAWFKQDNEQGRARSGYLYHALRLFDAHGKDGPYVVEESCLSRTEATFYWGVKQPPEVPEAESGVTYELNIRGYQDETGEYDCILMRRENLGYNMPAYETHEETGETRLRSEMLGVREDETTVDEKVADYAEEQGLELEDGPKTLDDGKTVVGVVVDLQKQKNRDCTTDVTLQNTHEEKSLEHVVETRETLRGKQTSTTHMHVTAEEAGEYKAGYDDGVLTVTHVEKTPGGVRNVTVTETDSTPVAAGDGNTVCAKTIYEHVHITLAENQSTATREPDDVEKWAGAYEQVQVIANDDGTFNAEVKKTTELEVEDSKTVTAKAYIESTEQKIGTNLDQETSSDANWKKTDQVNPPMAAPETPSNTLGPEARQPLYQTQREITPGGKENVTIVTTTPHPATAYIEFKEDYNGRKRRYGWFKNLTEAEAKNFCKSFTDGSISRNEFGLFDGTVAETSAGDGSGGGSHAFFNPFEATYKECSTSVQTDRQYQEDDTTEESFDVYVYIETRHHRCGIINGSAEQAYAKVAGAVGPVKVNQLSSPSMVNQGWYEYDYVYQIDGEWKKNGTTIRTEVIASGS